ncbi:cadherin-like beta sandwich domain-containing protein [Parasediminibacterium paludis]|uniref:Cadherin-like beta sandwich domain-containing protein n=1 Tax=Parasediminibacterium paludis TaxID=908966 RepID=A0ABV8PTX1_9BACT
MKKNLIFALTFVNVLLGYNNKNYAQSNYALLSRIDIESVISSSPTWDPNVTTYSYTISKKGTFSFSAVTENKYKIQSISLNMNGTQIPLLFESKNINAQTSWIFKPYVSNNTTSVFQLIVTAQDGITQKTYNISITNNSEQAAQPKQTTQTTQTVQAPLSNDATLSGIRIYTRNFKPQGSAGFPASGWTPFDKSFSSNVTNYTATFNANTTAPSNSIAVCARTSQSGSKVQISVNGQIAKNGQDDIDNFFKGNKFHSDGSGDDNFLRSNDFTVVPKNTTTSIEIVVTAPDGTTQKTYYVSYNWLNVSP